MQRSREAGTLPRVESIGDERAGHIVDELQSRGLSLRAIARISGVGAETVRRLTLDANEGHRISPATLARLESARVAA
ncbi:hypothetical protein GCM10010461_23440 [Microbacterium aurantiacum]